MIEISIKRLEGLMEQAYMNGISDGAISRMQTGSVTQADFKKSTAYCELKEIFKDQAANKD